MSSKFWLTLTFWKSEEIGKIISYCVLKLNFLSTLIFDLLLYLFPKSIFKYYEAALFCNYYIFKFSSWS